LRAAVMALETTLRAAEATLDAADLMPLTRPEMSEAPAETIAPAPLRTMPAACDGSDLMTLSALPMNLAIVATTRAHPADVTLTAGLQPLLKILTIRDRKEETAFAAALMPFVMVPRIRAMALTTTAFAAFHLCRNQLTIAARP